MILGRQFDLRSMQKKATSMAAQTTRSKAFEESRNLCIRHSISEVIAWALLGWCCLNLAKPLNVSLRSGDRKASMGWPNSTWSTRTPLIQKTGVERTCRDDCQCHNGEFPASRVRQWRPYPHSNATGGPVCKHVASPQLLILCDKIFQSNALKEGPSAMQHAENSLVHARVALDKNVVAWNVLFAITCPLGILGNTRHCYDTSL